MSTTNAVANSGATTTNGKEKNGTPKPAATVKPELSKMTVPAPKETEPAKLPSIQERVNKFYELEKLMEKRDSIIEHLEKLGGFSISSTGSAHLKITDDRGGSFGIAHPIVIGEMVYLAKTKLQTELASIEAAIIL